MRQEHLTYLPGLKCQHSKSQGLILPKKLVASSFTGQEGKTLQKAVPVLNFHEMLYNQVIHISRYTATLH